MRTCISSAACPSFRGAPERPRFPSKTLTASPSARANSDELWNLASGSLADDQHPPLDRGPLLVVGRERVERDAVGVAEGGVAGGDRSAHAAKGAVVSADREAVEESFASLVFGS